VVKRTARVLVVDDELDARELTRDILVREGHLVETAASGPEGLEKIKQGRFDLVLLDLVMPRMDGLEVLRRIKEMPAAEDVLVVYRQQL